MLSWQRSAVALFFASLVAVAPVAAQGGGRVRIPKDFRYGGETHGKGTYEVRIESASDGSYVVLSTKERGEVVRELAIVQETKGRVAGTQAGVEILTRDEPMVRVVVRQGTSRYLVYLETLG